MEIEQIKSIIESILFAAGRAIKITEFMSVLELGKDEIMPIMENLINEYKAKERGIEIIKINDGFQMCTKKENYEYLYQIFDTKEIQCFHAALETLSIIAYNPKITRAEIENIRGVNSDGTIYKLMEYGLIESAGKLDVPGRPTAYRTTDNFLKTFGFTSLEELPELPKYKLDENQQIVIDELIEAEAPSPSEETEEQENNIESEGE